MLCMFVGLLLSLTIVMRTGAAVHDARARVSCSSSDDYSGDDDVVDGGCFSFAVDPGGTSYN